MSLRKQAVDDLHALNTKDWSQDVSLIAPDGKLYEVKTIQILYDYKKINPETGQEIVVHEPVVVFSFQSLERIPKDGEKWAIKMPTTPSGESSYFTFSRTKALGGGDSLGYLKIYPQNTEQSDGGEG